MDATWKLTPYEIFQCLRLVDGYLSKLGIPERGEPKQIPAELALELKSQHWSRLLEPHFEAETERGVEQLVQGEVSIPLEVWRADFERQLMIAYPDLQPLEHLAFATYMAEMFDGLDVDRRRPTYLPESTLKLAASELQDE